MYNKNTKTCILNCHRTVAWLTTRKRRNVVENSPEKGYFLLSEIPLVFNVLVDNVLI